MADSVVSVSNRSSVVSAVVVHSHSAGSVGSLVLVDCLVSVEFCGLDGISEALIASELAVEIAALLCSVLFGALASVDGGIEIGGLSAVACRCGLGIRRRP